MPELKPKEVKYVVARVSGKSKRVAGLEAGAKSVVAADKYGERMSKNVEVQAAISYALSANEMTPQYLVSKLKEVIEQDKEIGAKRLAVKDGLELHGWRRNERPTVSLTVNQAFFGKARNNAIDAEQQA